MLKGYLKVSAILCLTNYPSKTAVKDIIVLHKHVTSCGSNLLTTIRALYRLMILTWSSNRNYLVYITS